MSLQKRYVIVALCFLIGGCQEKKAADIPIDKMKVVVLQLFKADEFIARMSVQDTNWKKSSQSATIYQKIFDLNKVDRTQFYNQMETLKSHPVEFKVLMDSVNELSKREKNGPGKY